MDIVITDPPYGMKLDTDFSSMKSTMADTQGGVYEKVLGDNDDFDPSLIRTIFDNFKKVEEVFVWGADYFAELIPDRNKGNFLVWDKTGGTELNLAYDEMYGSNFELCWSKVHHKRAIMRVMWKGWFGLSNQDTKKRIHPTQKPVGVVTWILDHFDKAKGTVADIYGGSGTTLIACEQTGRRCLMMELDPHYCDVIIKRWEDFTGKKAEKVSA